MPIRVVNNRDLENPYQIKGLRYVGRPTPLGNPYVVSAELSREEAIAQYKVWLWQEMKSGEGKAYEQLIKLRDRHLAGEEIILSCWCKPLDCHADIIVLAVEWMVDQHNQI